jgi:hypothetical protein
MQLYCGNPHLANEKHRRDARTRQTTDAVTFDEELSISDRNVPAVIIPPPLP